MVFRDYLSKKLRLELLLHCVREELLLKFKMRHSVKSCYS